MLTTHFLLFFSDKNQYGQLHITLFVLGFIIDFVTSLYNNDHGREMEEFEFIKGFHVSLCLCVEVQDFRVRML